MHKLFLGIFDYLQKRHRLCMGLMTLFIGLLVVMMSTLKYNENIYDFLPVSGNEQKAITLYQDITGGQRIVAMFSMADSASADVDLMTAAVDTFANKIETGYGKRHISEITTQVDFEKIAGITDFIYQNMPFMLTDSDYVRMEQQLASPEFVDQQLSHDVEMIMMPATGFFSSSITNDPLGLFSPVMQRLQSKQSSMPFEIENGYIFTPGRKYAIVMLTSPYGSMESANNSQLVEYVDSCAALTMQAVLGVSVATTGSPVIAVGNAVQIKSDSQWAISIAVTLILTLLVFSFRRVKNLLLIGFAIIFGWLFAMGFIAVMRSDVSLIVLGIGSIIIGIAVNYPLHFIAHTDHGGTIRDVLKEMIAPLLIGNITTVGAFASLMPLNAPALRDLGLFAAFMLVGTILFVLVFLPHLVKQRSEAVEERLTFGKLSTASPERHRWLLWIIFALTIVLGYFSLGISFDTNMHHINYMTDEQKALLSDLQASAGLNDTSNVYIVTEGDTWDEALSRRAQLSAVLDSLKQQQQLNKFTDVTTYVCSMDEQQHRLQLWNDFWTKYRQQVLSSISSRAPEYGFSDDAFTGFAEIVSADYSPQPFEHFDIVRSVLLTSSFSNSTGACSVVDVIDASNKDREHLEAVLNSSAEEKVYAFDFMGMNGAVAKSLSDDFNYIGFACGFIVFLFLWLSFGRLELSLLAFLPMAMGWLWILGLMYLFGMQFNIVNVILATFIFGQGDDYTIFITDGLLNEYAYKKKLLPSFKNSIIISALIMFIGIGSLIVAKHPALHSLAEVTIVGMLTVVLMAWIVPPFIFGWLVKNQGKTRPEPVTIEHIVRTFYGAVVYLFELSYGCVLGLLSRLVPMNAAKREAWFHRVIEKSMRADVNNIWGVKFHVRNDVGEDFSRGSVMICNHQSMLDPIYVLSLNPKIIVMVGGKVWRNPIVNTMFRLSRFINADAPIEVLQEKVSRAVADGYNVLIFPEGRRTDDHVARFHRGAFHLAQLAGADLLPLYLHGAGHVMPKGSGIASRGVVTIEIGKRIAATELSRYGVTPMEMAHNFHEIYVERYAQMKREIETTHYFHHYLISKYTYKGIGVEKETRRLLKRFDDFSRWIDGRCDAEEVSIVNAGRGQFSLMFALVHPDVTVHSYATDADDAAILDACEPKPSNLRVYCVDSVETALKSAGNSKVIDVEEVKG